MAHFGREDQRALYGIIQINNHIIMGDLQSFLDGSGNRKRAGLDIDPRLLMVGFLLICMLSGTAWMLFSWQQVRKATNKKMMIAAEIENLLAERDRLKKAQTVAELTLEGKEDIPASNDHVPVAFTGSEPQGGYAISDSRQLVENETPSVQRASISPPIKEESIVEKPQTDDSAELGNFLIVAGMGKTLERAGLDVKRLQDAGIDRIKVYYRNNLYRIVAGPFPTPETNVQLKLIKTKVNDTAYLVHKDSWCNSPVQKEGYIECFNKLPN